MTPRASHVVGLIGANIMKSLSPALHHDAFAAAGVRGHYHLMDFEHLPGRRLEDLLGAVKTAGFSGVNITFPVKQAVIPLLDAIADDARLIGAVNTVAIAPDGRTTGTNTDCIGFRRNLEDGFGPTAINGHVVALIGAGGAGRAVAFALMDLGAARLLIVDTNVAQAETLAGDLVRHYGANRARHAIDATAAIAAANGLVNATPIGMLGIAGPKMPVPAAALRADLWVADVIYTPMETELIKAARAKGAAVLTGGGMCVHQAAQSFRSFTGIAPDVERMQRVFLSALAARDAALAIA